MISRTNGINLKKLIANKVVLAKLAMAMVLSNVFFFYLFSDTSSSELVPEITAGHVEIEIKGELHTSFQAGKKVMLLNKNRTQKIDAILMRTNPEPEPRHLLQVKEEETYKLINQDNWEILPYVKSLKLVKNSEKEGHEIRY